MGDGFATFRHKFYSVNCLSENCVNVLLDSLESKIRLLPKDLAAVEPLEETRRSNLVSLNCKCFDNKYLHTLSLLAIQFSNSK